MFSKFASLPIDLLFKQWGTAGHHKATRNSPCLLNFIIYLLYSREYTSFEEKAEATVSR
jgi:hypothetical protein